MYSSWRINGFIIFGTTHSNNGDVSGNHSWSGYSDIWMVKLNSAGEIEWQQCYGGLNDEQLYFGIIKKTDFNWVIAGSFIYNTGDMVCKWHGLEDYWVFEIKDPSINIIDRKISEQGIKIYPNPAQDYVVFELETAFNSSEIPNIGMGIGTDRRNPPVITITNLYGQEVTKLPVKTEKTVWDTRQLKRGIYFYRLELEGKIISGKLTLI